MEGNLKKDECVSEISGIRILKKGSIVCVKEDFFLKKVISSEVRAIVIDKKSFLNLKNENNKIFLIVDNIQKAFYFLLKYFQLAKNRVLEESLEKNKKHEANNGIYLEAPDTIAIGENTKFAAPIYIGAFVQIGKNTHIGSNVYIGRNVIIKDGVFIQSNSSIGVEGFSYYDDLKMKKRFTIPHIGALKIGKNVTIGSNVSIARGTIENTEIGDNTKIDSQVHIGHNVIIGKRVYIAANTSIGGSVVIEDDVSISGHVSIVDHISIVKGTRIFGHSLVTKSIKKAQDIWGIPARNFQNEKIRWATINLMIKFYQNLKKKWKTKW